MNSWRTAVSIPKEQDGKALDLGNQLAVQNQPVLVCDTFRGKLQSL